MPGFSIVSDLKSKIFLGKSERISEKLIQNFTDADYPSKEYLQKISCIEGVLAKDIEAANLFVDFYKAFDFLHRWKMGQIILTYGVPKKNFYSNNDALQKYESNRSLTWW